MANSFAITVNVNTDLGSAGEVRNDTTGGASAGGSFALSSGVTLTANVFAGTATCVSLASGNASVVGNVSGGTGSNAYGITTSSTGTLTVTGSVTGGSGSGAHGVNATTNNSSVVVTGNVTAGAGTATAGVWADAIAVAVTITGNVTGANPANSVGVRLRNSSTLSLTGTVFGAGQPGVLAEGTGNVTIVGTAIGGTSGTAGVNATSSSSVTVVRAKGGTAASSGVGVSSGLTGTVSVQEIEYGDLGASPTAGPIRLTDATSNVAVMYRFGTTKKNLVDANASGLMPAASHVRSGTVYNGGNSTGTCAVPAAGSVALGVAVDNTTGTAVLTQANVEAALGAFSSGRLGNCATVASVGQQLADAFTTP